MYGWTRFGQLIYDSFGSKLAFWRHVHSTDPVLSWEVNTQLVSSFENDDNFVLGSGPCRALAGKEDIFKDICMDKFFSTVVVLEVDQKPPQRSLTRLLLTVTFQKN